MFSTIYKQNSLIRSINYINTSSKLINNIYKHQNCNFHILQGKKKSIFEQNQMNPYHLYPKKTIKPPQEKFQDENYKWETIPMPTKETKIDLLQIINKEELQKMKKLNPNKDTIRLGDKLEVEYYHSISSGKLYKYKGVVVSIKRPNSLSYCFKFLTMIGGNYVMLEYPYYSPMLKSIKVVSESNLNKDDKRSKIFSIGKIRSFGNKLNEVIKGGKNTSVNKKAKKEIRREESNKESIILE